MIMRILGLMANMYVLASFTAEPDHTHFQLDIGSPSFVFLNLQIGGVSKSIVVVFVGYRILLLVQNTLYIRVSSMTLLEPEHV
jgi:hypothetical protein